MGEQEEQQACDQEVEAKVGELVEGKYGGMMSKIAKAHDADGDGHMQLADLEGIFREAGVGEACYHRPRSLWHICRLTTTTTTMGNSATTSLTSGAMPMSFKPERVVATYAWLRPDFCFLWVQWSYLDMVNVIA